MKQLIETTINGTSYQLEIEPHWTLIELLRDVLRLTGAKSSCGTRYCEETKSILV